jgi:antitoxin PrlF
VPTATVTSKGRVTIPVEVRRSLGLKSGSRVDFVPRADGSYELVSATGAVTSLKGAFAPAANP